MHLMPPSRGGSMEKPSNKEEMLAVSGVGESKFEKYGEPFLACLAER